MCKWEAYSWLIIFLEQVLQNLVKHARNFWGPKKTLRCTGNNNLWLFYFGYYITAKESVHPCSYCIGFFLLSCNLFNTQTKVAWEWKTQRWWDVSFESLIFHSLHIIQVLVGGGYEWRAVIHVPVHLHVQNLIVEVLIEIKIFKCDTYTYILWTYFVIWAMLWFSNCWSSLKRISLIFKTSFFSSMSSCFSVLPSFSACCLASCSISLVISSMNLKMELSSPSTVAKRSPSILATGSRFAV